MFKQLNTLAAHNLLKLIEQIQSLLFSPNPISDAMEILDQSGNPELRKADSGNRIVAFLVDVILIGLMNFVPFAGWIAGIVYFLTRDSLPFLDGQSVGKKAMGLRTVTEDGQPLTNNWGPGIIRNIVLLIPLFLIVELIMLLTNQDGLRLGDQWAKTKVVTVK
jgi:uncharacterized RDD family membrane protein YckC